MLTLAVSLVAAVVVSSHARADCLDGELCWTAHLSSPGAGAVAGSGAGLGGLGLGLGLAAAAGGGGGGGGGGSPSGLTAGATIASNTGFAATPNQSLARSYETSEYQAGGGHGALNTSALWSVGGFGAGQTVHVIDSGVNTAHSELSGRVTRLSDHTGGDGTDSRGHGTRMVGLIAAARDGTGMVGVAPDANVVVSKIFDTGTTTSTANLNLWLPQALSQGRAAGAGVVSNSWGSESQIDDVSQLALSSLLRDSLSAFRTSVNAGQVLVFAAGNDAAASVNIEAGLPVHFSELEPGWLAVTAQASYANACGSAAAWCVAAPATGLSINTAGGYSSVSGTSVATAYVAGAMAALRSAFPSVTLRDIRLRLLQTADSSVGSASQTGQGMVDLNAALAPLGAVSVATTSGTGGGYLSLGSASGSSWPGHVSITGLDSAGFAFGQPLSAWSMTPVAVAADGLRQWQLTQSHINAPSRAWQPSAAGSRVAGLGIARLSGTDIGQWLRPVRWGDDPQGHPALMGWGQSWVAQHRSGGLESYSALDTEHSQSLGGVRIQAGGAWLDSSVHREQAGYLGVRSDLLQVPDTTTRWLGAGWRQRGLSLSAWHGRTTRGDQLSAYRAAVEGAHWTLSARQSTRLQHGQVSFGVSQPGPTLGAVVWGQQRLSLVPEGRERRVGLVRWLGQGHGWHGFVRADRVWDMGHVRGQRDSQWSAGLLTRF